MSKQHRGFTLVEALVVIAIVALMAAILFPVFAAARGEGRRTVCESNLRQLGTAVYMYAQDYNDQLPYAGDPCDLYTTGWAYTSYSDQVSAMKPIQDVLAPYVSSKLLWHCPSDTGYTACAQHIFLKAQPTAFDSYGTSYSYQTILTLRHTPISAVAIFDKRPPHTERGPAEVALFGDTSGAWHGGTLTGTPRYNVLLVDGHTTNVDQVGQDHYWNQGLATP